MFKLFNKIKKYKIETLIGLVIVLIFLICLDLGTGIWVTNSKSLAFDSTKFNNIVTPITGIVTVIGLAIGLTYTFRQNRISLSANIRPFLESKIERLYQNGLKIRITDTIKDGDSPYKILDTYNAYNYLHQVSFAHLQISEFQEFVDDITDFENTGIVKDYFYYYKRPYAGYLSFCNRFSFGHNEIQWLYSDIKNLVSEIAKSNLIDEDKAYLIDRIKTEIISEYINFIRIESQVKTTLQDMFPQLPFQNQNDPRTITFKHLYETNFADLYNWLKANNYL